MAKTLQQIYLASNDTKHVSIGLSLNLVLNFSSLKVLNDMDICQIEAESVMFQLMGQNKNFNYFHYMLKAVFWDLVASHTS